MLDRRRLIRPTGPAVAETGTINGLVFAQNPVVYDNNEFRLQTSWDETNSAGSKYGAVNGSTYFNFSEACSINIEGYRLPSSTDIKNSIADLYSRTGSEYIWDGGNVSNARYVLVWCSFYLYGYYGTRGMLFFPDGKTINGPEMSAINKINSSVLLTYEELNSLIKQGCLFLPCVAYANYNYSGWNSFDPSGNVYGKQGYYWTSTDLGTNSNAAYVHVRVLGGWNKGIDTTYSSSDPNTDKIWCMPVILCRDA